MTLFITIIYLLILIYTMGRILLDTRSIPKTLAYLLLVVAFPMIGIIFYFSFGINYRHRRTISVMGKEQRVLDAAYLEKVQDQTEDLLAKHREELAQYSELIHFLHQLGREFLSANQFKLLVNGEAKFPEVLATLKTAQRFIHMEYYDWENDIRGNQIKEMLLNKAAEGVKVRVLYDDYASRKIRHNIVKELKAGGVAVFPKIKVKLNRVANRMNHRDHRKVIIVDGLRGFLGGINISDRYDNSIDTGLWWRDTHVKVTGRLVLSLQRHFVVSWNSSQPDPLPYSRDLFPEKEPAMSQEVSALAQVIAGGPIYPASNIMLTYFKIFTLAREKLYITNPYFIPNESIMDALKQAALSGVDVRLMIPMKSDSMIVGLSANSYFEELLEAGVRIFLYKKGFVHAKTIVADGKLSVIGTANMDIRSFDLNFEIMSVIYSTEFGLNMENMYLGDLKECEEIDGLQWAKRGPGKKLVESIARLVSAFL
jgi:cardiolipin synthase